MSEVPPTPPSPSVTIPLSYFTQLLDIAYGKRPQKTPYAPPPPDTSSGPTPIPRSPSSPIPVTTRKETDWNRVDPARFREVPKSVPPTPTIPPPATVQSPTQPPEPSTSVPG